MDENKIINSFQKIKQDIEQLRFEIAQINKKIYLLLNPTQPIQTPTTPTQNPTQTPPPTDTSTHIPTIQQLVQPLSIGNRGVSIGNRGVPTDNPTDKQTIQQTNNDPEKFAQSGKIPTMSKFEEISNILDSLDSAKKEIRLKFKRLTPQEMLVFSTLYSLQEQKIGEITYKTIANNLNLSESSIRDYINRLLKKGIPILKVRQNNKKIILNISPDLQKIASLSTILRLREL